MFCTVTKQPLECLVYQSQYIAWKTCLLLGPFLLLRQCCHGSIGQPDGYRWSSRPFSIAMPAYRWHFSMLLNLLSLLVSLTFLKILRSVVGCWWCIPGFGNYGIHRIMLATYLKMPENGQNDHFQACRQWSPRVAKVQGGPQGWVRWVKTRSIIFESFSAMIFKIGPFPHWNSH